MATNLLPCDGCGQPAPPEHVTRRLQRLEWSTRYRPIHVATLLLGAVSPQADADFLYAGQFQGEAARLLETVGIEHRGRAKEAILSEFQRGGYFLAYVLDCPLANEAGRGTEWEGLQTRRAAAVIARIRRSLKPKRVILISERLVPLVGTLTSADLGCLVILDGDKPFALDSAAPSGGLARLREALSGTPTVR